MKIVSSIVLFFMLAGMCMAGDLIVKNSSLTAFTNIGTGEAKYDTITDDVAFPFWRVKVKTTSVGTGNSAVATPEATLYGITY